LLSSGEGVRGRIVLALFFSGLESWGPYDIECFLSLFPFQWDWPQSFALGVSSLVVVPPSHQHCASLNQPAPVAF